MLSGSGGGRGGSAASIPPTANASSDGGRRALGRAGVRAVVFHGLSTSTEGMAPPSRGAVEGEDGKGGDVAQGFTTVPLEAPENVLALTASVMRGGSNVDNVGEEENTDGEALRADGAVQSCNSPRLPPPGPRTRASRAVPYAS